MLCWDRLGCCLRSSVLVASVYVTMVILLLAELGYDVLLCDLRAVFSQIDVTYYLYMA